MKITESAIEMAGKHTYSTRQETAESLTLWTGSSTAGVILDLSKETPSLPSQTILVREPGSSQEFEYTLSNEDKLKIKLIEDFIWVLTGKKVKLKLPRLRINGTDAVQASPQWGMAFDFHRSTYEKESLDFTAEGKVKTADGREINIALNFKVQREFYSREELHLRAGTAAIDPLVISLDGSLPGLSSTRFSFDLDADGTPDQISRLLPGCGFLAWDKNCDGVINDGTELFGPQSGDGFAELALYDEDNNGWIDESDEIFKGLRIWVKDEQGRDYLVALGEAGIGAIYLGHLQTDFSHKSKGELLGQVKQTGLVLKENGQAHIMQHIDLAI